MSQTDPQAHADDRTQGTELAVLDLGYAFEMLRFWAHYLWFSADDQTPLPALLEAYAGPVVHGLVALTAGENTDDAKQALAAAERDFTAAWTHFKAQWLGDEHCRQLRFLQDSDAECIADDWDQQHSPLNWDCFAAATDSLREAAALLPEPLPACYRTGLLCARVECLSRDSACQTAIPGELYPITAAQHALIQLKGACPLLADVDVDLGHAAGGGGPQEAKRRCRTLYAEIRHRFANAAPSADRQSAALPDGTAMQAAEEVAVKPARQSAAVAKTHYTPPELAKQWNVSPDKVRAWIASGELEAFDASTTQGGRPRYLIRREAVEAFEARRSIQKPPEPAPRRSRRADDDVIEFY